MPTDLYIYICICNFSQIIAVTKLRSMPRPGQSFKLDLTTFCMDLCTHYSHSVYLQWYSVSVWSSWGIVSHHGYKIKPLYSLVLVCCNINLASYIVNFTEVYLSLLFNMTMVSLVIVKRLLDFLIIFIRPAFEPIWYL